MYLGNADMELLLLAARCKNLPSDMSKSIYVPSMAARRDAPRGGDIWGGAAFWGLGCHGNTAITACQR